MTPPRPTCLVLALLCLAVLSPLARAESASDSTRIGDLERMVSALSQEVEALKLGAVAETAAVPHTGLAPAASKVYGVSRGLAVGGYGEMLFGKPDRTREDGARSELSPTLDLLRAVFYLGYKFSDELLLNTEIELEHAGVFDVAEVATNPATGAGEAELSGEATIEFAYLEWARFRGLGVRAGKLLVPVGLTNELHEPPTFPTVQRPDVERFIIPTTWAGKGAGVFGELPVGLAYRAYVLEGLDARGLEASSGIREGRQQISAAVLHHPAFTARLDWIGTEGVLAGVSGYIGDGWQAPQPGGPYLSAQVTLVDAHARIDLKGLRSRLLYAHGHVDQSEQLSDALALTGSARIGETFQGGYVEAAYDVLPLLRPGSGFALSPYGRYEEYDTQDGVAAPGSEDPAFHRRVTTAGLEVKPHPNVAVKGERQWRANEAETGTGQWNLAVGYLF